MKIKAKVIDTNRKPKGVKTIDVEFGKEGPISLSYDGSIYSFTGKKGLTFSTGQLVFEMATGEDARVWISKDGSQIEED
jgi:hypothetical protein